MTSFWITNLWPYSLQLGVIVAATGLVLALLRVRSPRARLVVWRFVLAIALLLPLQPWRIAGEDSSAAGASARSGASASTAATDARDPRIPASGATDDAAAQGTTVLTRAIAQLTTWAEAWGGAIAVVLVAGTIARLMWLAFGWWRLQRRLQSDALRIDLVVDADVSEWQERLGTAAQVEWRDDLSQPITFGVWPPVVLLPARLATLSPDVRRAVICHELLHVRQRDWLWVLGEEIVRAGLWFHPAMWWLLDQLQSAREEMVDRLTLRTTGQRRPYLEALLAFASEPAEPSRGPAAAFFRSRHLARRIASLMTEVQMSPRQRVATGVALSLSLAGSVIAGMSAFPLQESQPTVPQSATPWPGSPVGRLEQQARSLAPDEPPPARIHQVPFEFPSELEGHTSSANVVVRFVLAADGTVAEARVLSYGFERRAARSPADASSTTSVVEDGAGRRLDVITPIPADAVRALLGERTLATIRQWRYEPVERAPLAMTMSVHYRRDGRAGDPGAVVGGEEAPGLRETLVVSSSFGGPTPGVAGGVANGEPGGVNAGVVGGVPGGVAGGMTGGVAVGTIDRGVPPGVEGRGAAGKRLVRVGGDIHPPRKLVHVAPIYPETARAAGVQGIVILETELDEDGLVTSARVLRSVPELDQAALDAVAQWRYTPTLLNGVPVAVLVTVTIQFSR